METGTDIRIGSSEEHHRLLGGLAMVGALSYAVGAYFLFAQGVDYPRGVELFGVIWALGSVCGLLGIAAIGAAGNKLLGRVAVGIAIFFYALVAIDSLLLVLGIYPAMESPLFAVSRLGTLVAMLLVGIATLLTGRWAGWRKFVPFAIPLVMPIAALVGAVTGTQIPIPAYVALAWFIIGYAVWSTPDV